MTINWKLRFKNPLFWMGLVGVILSPVLAAKGMTVEDLTTWNSVADVLLAIVTNPYILGSTITVVLSFLGVTNDPTRAGLSDSENAMTYTELK